MLVTLLAQLGALAEGILPRIQNTRGLKVSRNEGRAAKGK
jgi:hypothetical protein